MEMIKFEIGDKFIDKITGLKCELIRKEKDGFATDYVLESEAGYRTVHRQMLERDFIKEN